MHLSDTQKFADASFQSWPASTFEIQDHSLEADGQLLQYQLHLTLTIKVTLTLMLTLTLTLTFTFTLTFTSAVCECRVGMCR